MVRRWRTGCFAVVLLSAAAPSSAQADEPVPTAVAVDFETKPADARFTIATDDGRVLPACTGRCRRTLPPGHYEVRALGGGGVRPGTEWFDIAGPSHVVISAHTEREGISGAAMVAAGAVFLGGSLALWLGGQHTDDDTKKTAMYVSSGLSFALACPLIVVGMSTGPTVDPGVDVQPVGGGASIAEGRSGSFGRSIGIVWGASM